MTLSLSSFLILFQDGNIFAGTQVCQASAYLRALAAAILSAVNTLPQASALDSYSSFASFLKHYLRRALFLLARVQPSILVLLLLVAIERLKSPI